MELNYFDVEHAISVHDAIIEKSGGLLGGVNKNQLDATLTHIQNDDYYPDFITKTTQLFYGINKGHCFTDGNKRSSIALVAYFLEINNVTFIGNRFFIEMENVAVDVANNIIIKKLLAEILDSLIFENEYNESLKLKIIKAKSSYNYNE
ncbi:MAG: type II toxin-antitoxin system death-on-curing family toxin [Bacteroidia bacterium]|nr:type II toxin-antitoxin system death-on-curing family toxin [Bacteroidia bacterium]